MFIDASVSPAKASLSAWRGLIGNRPPKIGNLISSPPFHTERARPARPWAARRRAPRLDLQAAGLDPPARKLSGGRRHDGASSQFCHLRRLPFRRPQPTIAGRAALATSSNPGATMDYRKEFRVDPGAKIKLKKLDPAYTGKHLSHDEAKKEIETYLQKLFDQQALLYAEHKHSILVVLQALDAGGKDGTIKHVFTALNPQGTFVTSFKQPTPAELAHDFLWRVHPMRLERARSPSSTDRTTRTCWSPGPQADRARKPATARYQHIRDFEALLIENGTTIIKFFLHISKEEQLARFAQRLDDPNRNWKISESDYTERELWDDYMEAFEDAIRATTAKEAPWYVIPSNHKWFRNLAVSQIMADTMEDLKLAFPPPSVDLAVIRRKYHAALEEEKGARKRREVQTAPFP